MGFGDILLAGGALMLVFEGLMPFVAPAKWKETMRQAISMSDGQLRFIGLLSMLAGLGLLFLLK
jgi:uncharacterized protein